MKTTFSADQLRAVARSFNRYGPRLLVRCGRFNGVFAWLSADQYYERVLHANLLKREKLTIKG